jgi:hypothetical protein
MNPTLAYCQFQADLSFLVLAGRSVFSCDHDVSLNRFCSIKNTLLDTTGHSV